MAIKVIEAGPAFFVVRCSVCSTKFGYQTEDIKRFTPYDTGHVNCPTCAKRIAHTGGKHKDRGPTLAS